MNVDLHAHYPMHVVPGGDTGTVLTLITSPEGEHLRLRDRVRSRLVGLASRFANYPTFSSGPAVTVPLIRDGELGVVCSVLYSPFDEMDLTKLHGYGLPPEPHYFDAIVRQLQSVEESLAGDSAEVAIARDPVELDAVIASGRTAMVHCVEGGHALGADEESIAANVATLAQRGVVYVGIAHLVYRALATNAPALPFLPDWAYRLLFRQPRSGLTALGRAAVRAMVAHGVLIDITHMSTRSLADTFALLDEIDPQRSVPVIASHIACRFGDREYNMSDETITAVAARGGVMGVIFCDHYIGDGLAEGTQSFEGSMALIEKHIDRIRSVTGSFDHVALGSDLDGYIKPALKGLGDMSRFPALRAALAQRYGDEAAEAICAGNALRVMRAAWRKPFTA